MRWSVGIGTLFGIRVELHVTFLLFVAWIALSQGLLAGDLGRAATVLLLLLIIFGCVLLHELGHALTARRYGIRTRDIILLPIGGVARLQRMPDQPQQEIVVALAGPAVNVVLALAAGGALAVLGQPIAPWRLIGDPLSFVLTVNVFMVVFNLIPAFPMDGGRVLRALLALRMPYLKATRIASAIGQGFALLFGVLGFFYNPMLLFIALFVFLAAAEEHALVRARDSMTGLPARAAMVTEFQVLDAADPLQSAIDRLIAGSQQDFPVVERGRAVGVLTRADLLQALQSSGAGVALGDVVDRQGPVAEAGEPLEDAFRRMREGRRQALLVVSGGELVGLLTLENVSELLLIADARRQRRGRD